MKHFGMICLCTLALVATSACGPDGSTSARTEDPDQEALVQMAQEAGLWKPGASVYTEQVGDTEMLVIDMTPPGGNCQKSYVSLDAVESFTRGINQSMGVTHSCSGNPCSSCGGGIDVNGLFECVCNGSGKCDHTVTY